MCVWMFIRKTRMLTENIVIYLIKLYIEIVHRFVQVSKKVKRVVQEN